LRAKLERGEMSAVLDVFDPEPLPSSSPLWRTPNLIMTPHCGSDDTEYYTPRTLDLVLDNIGRLMQGRRLKNRVRADIEY
jgi:phosphoglycerate dehydrogenase-like enzyme